MKDISHLLKQSNLIYYEYDDSTKIVHLDQAYAKEASMELVSITHLLQKHRIAYMIDKKCNLHIMSTPSLFGRIIQGFKNILNKLVKKQTNIFILSDKDVDYAVSFPVSTITIIPSEIIFDQYDGVIFTSKNAVKAVDSFAQGWKNKPAYVLAPQTAKMVKKLKGQLRFVGKSHYGSGFIKELLEPLQGKRMLYLRAKDVASDISKLLNDENIKCDEVIVYETICKEFKERIVFPQGSVIIFTAPSMIDCFVKNADWDKTYTAIAIGNTTAQHFPEHITPYIAATTSIDSCVRKALEIDKNKVND